SRQLELLLESSRTLRFFRDPPPPPRPPTLSRSGPLPLALLPRGSTGHGQDQPPVRRVRRRRRGWDGWGGSGSRRGLSRYAPARWLRRGANGFGIPRLAAPVASILVINAMDGSC
ncbi:Os06g0218150, partial [Oryza sativa Japonica Group]